MKIFATLVLLISSLSALAQASYEMDTAIECLSGETCLINQKADFVVKTVPLKDDQGVVVGERLSSESNIADTLHPKATYCFQGEAHKVCDILNLMAYDDGHILITHFSCQVVNHQVSVHYDVYYDMGPGIDKLAFLLKNCE